MTILGTRSGLFAGPIFIAAAIIMAGAGAAQAAGADLAKAFDKTAAGRITKAGLEYVPSTEPPSPIMFVANETTFTPLGIYALRSLILLAKHVPAITLIGHASSRGGPHEGNMELSRRRVIAVRDTLMENGAKAEIRIEWKGDLEPFDTSVLPGPAGRSWTQDEIRQLDDRVEVVVPR